MEPLEPIRGNTLDPAHINQSPAGPADEQLGRIACSGAIGVSRVAPFNHDSVNMDRLRLSSRNSMSGAQRK